MSEPLLTCFGCGRTGTLEDLPLFPWWDPHAAAFDTMRICNRCRPKARAELERMLRSDERVRAAFREFARRHADGASDGSATEVERILDAFETNAATSARMNAAAQQFDSLRSLFPGLGVFGVGVLVWLGTAGLLFFVALPLLLLGTFLLLLSFLVTKHSSGLARGIAAAIMLLAAGVCAAFLWPG